MGQEFMVENGVKNLRVMLDKKITMGKQVEQAAKNMKNETAALTKVMTNTRGWLGKSCAASVAHSVGLYAAPLWAKAMTVERYRRELIAAQRNILLRTNQRKPYR
ncbi:hypothetical protein HHI36_011333 [Cryptolaemus montrouzieri]|uniref:Uncharacterized protein n=1 Tax=Cryptolaemus montrouzieri TaxID=559131 RepID=A0ABD2MLF6_9CUCU